MISLKSFENGNLIGVLDAQYDAFLHGLRTLIDGVVHTSQYDFVMCRLCTCCTTLRKRQEAKYQLNQCIFKEAEGDVLYLEINPDHLKKSVQIVSDNVLDGKKINMKNSKKRF